MSGILLMTECNHQYDTSYRCWLRGTIRRSWAKEKHVVVATYIRGQSVAKRHTKLLDWKGHNEQTWWEERTNYVTFSVSLTPRNWELIQIVLAIQFLHHAKHTAPSYKAISLQAWTGPVGSRRLRHPEFLDQSAHEGGKVASPTHRPLYAQWYTPGTVIPRLTSDPANEFFG